MKLPDLPLFSQLDRVEQKVIRMRAEGIKLEAIAASCNLSNSSLGRWMGPEGSLIPAYNEFKEWLAERTINEEKDLQAVLKSGAEKAVKRLVFLATKKQIPLHTQLNAIDSLLDRIGIIRSSKSENVTEFKGLPEDERDKIYAKVLSFHKRTVNDKPPGREGSTEG